MCTRFALRILAFLSLFLQHVAGIAVNSRQSMPHHQIPVIGPGVSGGRYVQDFAETSNGRIEASLRWHVLGPFRSGTREATWGTDPLEAYGGFHSLSYDPDASFESALGNAGVAQWSEYETKPASLSDGGFRTELDLSFPDIDWGSLQSVYGWAALQYQAWARGSFNIVAEEPQTVRIFVDGLLELRIDGESFFGGDFYSYRRAPIILKLAPGNHVVDLRFVRDVRKDGATSQLPRAAGVCEVQRMGARLELDPSSVLLPESVGGLLASPWASVIAHNGMDSWVEVTELEATHGVDVELFSFDERPLLLAPYQSRPIAVRVKSSPDSLGSFSVHARYKPSDTEMSFSTDVLNLTIQNRPLNDAHRFTFMHPGGIVSYAVLRSPQTATSTDAGGKPFPILLGLHGAGLEADSELVRHMLDASYGVPAWTLFSTGGTAWSGDDWHTWGVADVQAAVDALPQWMEQTRWKGPGASLTKWIVVGHSNGGQGAWHLLTHEPDKVVAAAPVSGYSSIENYVPFTMWHEADAMLAAIFHAARQSFKHELLVDNFAGTPILQQHGSGDENVPVYHSRLMHQLAGPGRTRYVELLGEPHWRDGVLETKPLLEFYNATAEKPCQLLPWNFSLVVPPAAVVGAKGGIKAGQLLTPGRAGRIDVAREDGETWRLRTRNIKSFHVELSQRVPFPSKIYIDQGNTAFDLKTPGRNETVYFANSLGNWRIAASHDLSSPEHRSGRQIGALDAILRSKGPIMIYTSFGIKGNAIACQVSRNLLQYYGADSRHTQSHAEAINGNTGNVITIAVGGDLPPSMISSFPIHVLNGSLVIASQLSGLAATYPFSPGLFAAFLRPLANERLELVFWGADKAGLQHAARLLPMLTGVGQPDFVVGTKEHCALQGAAGLKAAGFFDWEWKIGKESYVSE